MRYVTKDEETQRLVVKFTADEAAMFAKVAGTTDKKQQVGIAKSLLLGAEKVVESEQIKADAELLYGLYEYAVRGDLPMKQEYADELSYTVKQLEIQSVCDAMCGWASFGRDRIMLLRNEVTATSVNNQMAWYIMSIHTDSLFETLKQTLAKAVGRAVSAS